MGNRWQRVWGVSWGLLGLWSTSWPSLWWSSTRELSFYLLLCCVRLCVVINRDVRYTVMILFYNLLTCVCDWSLGTHEFSAFNFILKIRCDKYNKALKVYNSTIDSTFDTTALFILRVMILKLLFRWCKKVVREDSKSISRQWV